MSSAGAGKTRALTKRFLYLFLHEADYPLKSLYGITFTNEAAFEMKTRVLEYLELLINGTSDDKSKMEIIEYFNSHFSNVKERAKYKKRHLLNNLSEFNIYTFHSLFASFLSSIPFAAGILPGYRIIDDAYKSVVYESVLDKFFEGSGHNEARLKIIQDFIQAQETRVKASIESIYWSIIPWLDFLGELMKGEQDIRTSVEVKGNEFARSLRQLTLFIREHGDAGCTKDGAHLNKDLLRLCVMVDKYLETRDFGVLEKSEYTKSILRCDLDGKNYLVKFAGNLGIEKRDIDKLLNTLFSCTDDYLRSLSDQQIAVYLKPLLEIHNLFKEEKRARNLVSFDDIESLTMRALEISPDIEYLYFKIGAEINHLMIDEFQDTSYRQLEIIVPLISEIVSLDPDEKSLFYVGDPKQAIFRWRGGASELFDVLINKYPGRIKREELTTNHRSKAEVIDFVNLVLDKKDKVEPGNTGGWVRVEEIGGYTDMEQGRQEIIERTSSIIKELHNNLGYEYSDLAVLVRTNKFGVALAEGLTRTDVPHVSRSKCDIMSDADVRTMVKLLEFLDDPENDFALLHALLSPFFAMDEEVLRRLMHRGKTFFLMLRNSHPGWPAVKKLERLLALVHFTNPYELIYGIYEELEIEVTYALATLLDVALEYTSEDSGHLSSFLDWLGDIGKTIQVKDAHPQGVQILTIHKAKGLEFDVILLPETNWAVKTYEDRQLLFSYKANGVEPERIYWRTYGKYLRGLKDAEQDRLQMDELNLLYVALTRARNGIHVLGFNHRKRGLGFWFERIVEKVGASTFSRGEITKKKEIKPAVTEIQKYGVITRESPFIKEERSLYSPTERGLEIIGVSRRQGMEFGSMIHQALSKIEWLDNIELQVSITNVVRSVQDKYARQPDDAQSIEKRLAPFLVDTLTDPDLRSLFFKDGRHVVCKNEVPIYFEDKKRDVSGQIDRLIVSARHITIVDYKTGEEEAKHQQQLRIYKKGIEKIYPGRCIEIMLVYLDKDRGKKITRL